MNFASHQKEISLNFSNASGVVPTVNQEISDKSNNLLKWYLSLSFPNHGSVQKKGLCTITRLTPYIIFKPPPHHQTIPIKNSNKLLPSNRLVPTTLLHPPTPYRAANTLNHNPLYPPSFSNIISLKEQY